MRKRRLSHLLTVLLLITALLLSVGVAYARYREELSGDIGFQAKPLEPVAFTEETWRRTGDSVYLDFSVGQTNSKCRIYLAFSEGFTVMDHVSVSLLLPGEESEQIAAIGEPIPTASGVYGLFGAGYVFRFLDTQTGQELPLELQPDAVYTLMINGLEDAAEQTGLVRLFVERIEE